MPRLIVCFSALAAAVSAPALLAQTGSMRVTLPSPTAASLGKFGDVPVSLSTGVPDITIPLFTAKGRTLEVPIVLKYHAGGIRVQEIAGWAGLGWTLDAGGTITRTVRGIVDERPAGYFNTGHTFYSGANWSSPGAPIIDNLANEVLDGEPDQFFFSFAGRSGEFVMGPIDSVSTKAYRTIPYQKILIQPTITSGQIQQWVITTEDGTRYTFAAKETNTDYNSTSPSSQVPAHFGESYVSSWHLTEIRSTGGDVITLYYGSYSARHQVGTFIEEFDEVNSNPAGCVPSLPATVTNEYEVTVQRLDSIKAAAHTIKLTTALRSDALHPTTAAQQERRIDKIIVTTPTGTVLRQFLFDHDYFSGNRLRLRNVYEQDASGNSLPPYSFTYSGQPLPSIASSAQDHWGFYNGATSNSSLIPSAVTPSGAFLWGADRSPDATAMRIGILTKITYPTGGYNEFIYEANDYGAIGGSATVPTDSGPQESSVLNANGFDGLVTKTFTIGGTEAVVARVNVSLDPACGTQVGCPWAEIVGVQIFHDPGTYYLELDPDTYTQRASDEAAGGHASISVWWREVNPVGKKTAGGLRIAELRTADAMGNVTTRQYKYTLQSDTTKSSGVVNAEPDYTYQYGSPTCSYFSRSSASKMPLGGGAPVFYREVTVWQGINGEYGTTRHTFRSVTEAQDAQPLFNRWPFSRTTSREWKRGQQTGVREYDASSQLMKRDTLLYAFRDEGTADTATTRKFRGISINQFSAGQSGTSYVYNPFEVISAWTYQSDEMSTFYNESGGGSFSTTRTFSYDNPRHAQLTRVVETNSDGRQRITRMKYPADFPTGSGNPEASALTAMQGSAHMHSPVIERLVIEKVGSTETILEAVLTTFKLFGTGQYLPYQRFVINIPGALP